MRQLVWMLTVAGLLMGTVLAQEKAPEERGTSAVTGSQQHDYASLRNVSLSLDDFEVRARDGRRMRVSELVKEGKIVLLHFFATFCHNSNYDVVTVNDLYRTYRDAGFTVVGISEYSTDAELEKFAARHQPLYPLVAEEETGRKKTRHYRYRSRVGDDRKWGTPFNVVIDGREIDPQSGTIGRQVYVATGELVRAEIESLIRRRLSEERGSRPDER
ncbi:MAG: hypothetical protein RIR52_200 [Acidobacteriota bacterium]